MTRRRSSLACCTAILGSMPLLCMPAMAQETAPAAPAPVEAVPEVTEPEVVISGSRVVRHGFDAPTPTTIVGEELIQDRGATNVGDFLSELPAFRASQSAQTNPQNSQNFGSNFSDLRGLGNIRTLTLVNGRRHVPSSPTGQVDLNLIPTVLVDRVEVVTGGASAAWGSDAVAGVVNVITRTKLEGLRGDVSYGLTEYGDNRTFRAALAFGGSFAEDRGRIVIGGEYVNNTGIDGYADRDWGREWVELVSYTGARPAGAPSRFYARGVTQTTHTYGGLIIGPNANPGGPLYGIQFGPGGAVMPFDYGTQVGAAAIDFTGLTPGNLAAAVPVNIRDSHILVAPMQRYVASAYADYRLTDDVKLFAEAGYAGAGIKFPTPLIRDTNTTGIVIRRDNPYLPAAVATIMDNNGITSFPMGRATIDMGETRSDNSNTTARFVIGLEGSLGGGWTWDAYYQAGRNEARSLIYDMRIKQNFAYAVDAIRDGSGAIVCRDATARALGCKPLDLFGVGAPSAEATAYVNGTQFYEVTTEQQVAAANLRGEPFSTWAGPVSIATGVEYRREKTVAVVDDIAASTGYFFSNPQPFAGTFDVKEGYVEAVVPLARDLPFAQSLEFNGAFRYTDYSVSGGVETWKLGLTWQPIEAIRLRGTRSRDIRAPNASELFAVTSNRGTLRNPFNGLSSQYSIVFAPSASLQPEKADTWTAGIVLRPGFLPNFQASVDFYDITVGGAIASFGAQNILDNCYAEIQGGGAGPFCAFVDRSGTGAGTVINEVQVQLLNIGSLRARGVDFEMSYRFPAFTGSVTTRLFGTYTANLIFDDGTGVAPIYNAAGVIQSYGSVIDRAGQVGGFATGGNTGATNAPHWVLNGSIGYGDERLRTSLNARWVQGGRLDNALVGPDSPDYDPTSPISIADNTIKGRVYLNLSASYRLFGDDDQHLEVYGVVNNLTNVDPPFPAVAIAGLYDRIGRNVTLGVRFAY